MLGICCIFDFLFCFCSPARVAQVLDDFGLVIRVVRGDGHCLFRCFEFLDGRWRFMGWRGILADQIMAKATHDRSHGWFLHRANDALRARGVFYESFEDFILGFRSNQWGYADFVTEFGILTESIVIVIAPDGQLQYIRHRSISEPREVFFLQLMVDEEGMLTV